MNSNSGKERWRHLLQVLIDVIVGGLNDILLGMDLYCYFMCLCIMLGV